jgi:copper chaperone CopZ
MKLILHFILAVLFCFVSDSAAQAQTADTTITVKVKGVGCATDIQMIQANVNKLKGVNTCETVKTGAITSFEVVFDPNMVQKEGIVQAIEDTPGCEDPDTRPYKVKDK